MRGSVPSRSSSPRNRARPGAWRSSPMTSAPASRPTSSSSRGDASRIGPRCSCNTESSACASRAGSATRPRAAPPRAPGRSRPRPPERAGGSPRRRGRDREVGPGRTARPWSLARPPMRGKAPVRPRQRVEQGHRGRRRRGAADRREADRPTRSTPPGRRAARHAPRRAGRSGPSWWRPVPGGARAGRRGRRDRRPVRRWWRRRPRRSGPGAASGPTTAAAGGSPPPRSPAVDGSSTRSMPNTRRSSRWVQTYSGLPISRGTVAAHAAKRSHGSAAPGDELLGEPGRRMARHL